MYLLARAVPPDSTLKKLQFYSTRAAYTKAEVNKLFQNFPLKFWRVHTRKLTPKLRERYTKKGINPIELKEAFQSRYVVLARKA